MTIAHKSGAAATLRRNGKSFWFASLFLPRGVAADAARLYAFCRAMDDLADVAVTAESQAVLAQVRAELRGESRGGASSNPDARDFLALAKQYSLPLDAADCLIATFIEDATAELHIEDEDELVRYCYGVAGTVGLMMSAILGAPRPQADEAAIHLGIAMQMTNIARDVLEDAKNHRRYLPGRWVRQLTARQIAHAAGDACGNAPPDARELVSAAVARLLDLADRYYASAAQGFDLIPGPARAGIEIAAAVYREIGTVLRRNRLAWWAGRVRVPFPAKLRMAIQVRLGRSPIRRLQPLQSIAGLSRPLAGLPGAR